MNVSHTSINCLHEKKIWQFAAIISDYHSRICSKHQFKIIPKITYKSSHKVIRKYEFGGREKLRR